MRKGKSVLGQGGPVGGEAGPSAVELAGRDLDLHLDTWRLRSI